MTIADDVHDIPTRFLIRIPHAPEGHTLHPSTVVSRERDRYTAKVDCGDERLPLAPGQVVYALYHVKQKFLQQVAEIESLEETDDGGSVAMVVRFRIAGAPASAESREYYRVSTAADGYTVEVGQGQRCLLWDICPTGLSFETTEAYELGDVLPVTLRDEDRKYTGRCSVQSIRRLPRGRRRCGLLCIDDPRGGATLLRGLKRMSMAIQRRHLSRLARLR